MSRAAVAARQTERRAVRELVQLDAWRDRLERDRAQDAVLATCDECGLVQVAADSRRRACVLCGHRFGTFVETLPGHLVPYRTDTAP